MFSPFSQGQYDSFKPGDNSGKNKLERIESVEKHLVKMDSLFKDLKEKVEKSNGNKDLVKKVDEITKNQKKILNDIQVIKNDEISRLKKKVEFIDNQKVEKLIEKFNLYINKTDNKLKILQESLKEIDEQLKTVDSPLRR